MSLDAAFAKAAEGALREMCKRAEERIVALAARPSALYRPELMSLEEVHPDTKVFMGREELNDGYGGWYQGSRRYDTGRNLSPCWRATYHGVVAYGISPGLAYDEFDHLFARDAWTTKLDKRTP